MKRKETKKTIENMLEQMHDSDEKMNATGDGLR